MTNANLSVLGGVVTIVLASGARGDVLTSFTDGTIAPGTSSYFVSASMFEEGSYNIATWDTFHPSWSDFYDHTSGDASGRYMVVNGASGGGGGMAWAATVAVTAGTDYTLGAWFASVYSFATASLRFRVVGDTTLSGIVFGAPDETGVWEHTEYTFNTGTSTSISVQIWDVSGISDGNDYAIDDITLEAVPSPGTLAALALGSLFSMRGRRRTNR